MDCWFVPQGRTRVGGADRGISEFWEAKAIGFWLRIPDRVKSLASGVMFGGMVKRRTDNLALFFRQTIKQGFFQMPLADEIWKDEEKLRVAIIEQFVDLSPFPAKVILDLPHVG